MRTIDIRTTQNVTITYEIASLRDRILAFVIDLVALIGLAILLGLITLWIATGDDDLAQLFTLLVVSPSLVFYTFILESLNNGKTLGKMAMRLKVVKLDGKQLNNYDYLLRWTFRLIDIWFSLGSLAAILNSSSDNGQRLGGLVSNSTVVRVSPHFRVTLKEILKINTRENYEPVYPDVRQFREDDMLLIKQAIERYAKYKNQAHKEAILELVEVVRERLGISEEPKNKIKFLKTLIKDYIVLTR